MSADFRPYTVEVLGDGSLRFTCTGLDDVQRVRRGSVAITQVQEIARTALALGFFEWKGGGGGYNDQIVDILEVRISGAEHRVVSVAFFGPEELARASAEEREERLALEGLARRIDAAVGTETLLAELIAEEPR